MSFLSPKKNIQILLLSLGTLFLAVYFFNFFYVEKIKDSRRDTVTEIITYEGLPENTKINATLRMNKTTSALETKDGSLSLTLEQQAQFNLPYKIDASFRQQNGEYYDLSWSVEEQGVKYAVLLDGFDPDESIMLFINDVKSNSFPVDWSGRIELPVLLHADKDYKICTKTSKRQPPFVSCHHLKGAPTL